MSIFTHLYKVHGEKKRTKDKTESVKEGLRDSGHYIYSLFRAHMQTVPLMLIACINMHPTSIPYFICVHFLFIPIFTSLLETLRYQFNSVLIHINRLINWISAFENKN